MHLFPFIYKLGIWAKEMGAGPPLKHPSPDNNTYLDAHTGMCGSSWVGHKYWVIFIAFPNNRFGQFFVLQTIPQECTP